MLTTHAEVINPDLLAFVRTEPQPLNTHPRCRVGIADAPLSRPDGWHRRRETVACCPPCSLPAAMEAAHEAELFPPSAELYADPANPMLPKTEMVLDLKRTALVVIDPQVEVMSPKGPRLGRRRRKRDREQSRAQSRRAVHRRQEGRHRRRGVSALLFAGITNGCVRRRSNASSTISAPSIARVPTRWKASAPPGRFHGGFKPFIEDGKTIICASHKVYGPQRTISSCNSEAGHHPGHPRRHARQHVRRIPHARSPRNRPRGRRGARRRRRAELPDGDGYLAALINFRFMANAVWTTDETVARLGAAA